MKLIFIAIQEWILTVIYLPFLLLSKQQLYFFDLDHTLADTAMILGKKEKKYKVDYACFLPMKAEIINIVSTKQANVFLFSARSISTYLSTRKWLQQIGLGILKNKLLIAKSPAHKLRFIKILLKFGKQITLVDDMAYNYQNGLPEFYTKEIEIIKKLNITYVDFYQISKINQVALLYNAANKKV